MSIDATIFLVFFISKNSDFVIETVKIFLLIAISNDQLVQSD